MRIRQIGSLALSLCYVATGVADILVANSRDPDTPCRYGGDEFVLLLLDMDVAAAASVANRLHDAVSTTCVPWDGGEVCVTISAGVATAPTSSADTLEALIERADRALYAAKHNGRDRVEIAGAAK